MPVSRVVPVAWLPAGARVERVIMHWTAGTYTPSLLDRAHYHLLIDGLGQAARGVRPPGSYLPHTRMLNTGSVGLAICGMHLATESPWSAGPYPITYLQWERACQAAAEVLHAYSLPVSERTLLCHSEVGRVYGRAQRGKWDIDRLPHDLTLSPDRVHAEMRRKALWYLGRLGGG